MIKVNCGMQGCKSVFESNDVVSPNGMRYICSHHTDEELRQAGISVSKRTDKDVHFQDCVFDKDLKAAKVNRYYTKPLPLTPEFPTSSILVKEN